MFDGGGAGQSGDRFGGTFGGISNSLGFSPAEPGDRSGSVYQGPNIDGSSGYFQDPRQMGVDTSTGFITSDNNAYRPAPPAPAAPQFDAMAYLAQQGREDTVPNGALFSPPAAPPAAPAAPAGSEPSGPFVPPNLSYLLSPSGVSAPTPSQFTFEQYLAQLPRPLAPPPVTPLGIGPMGQGIGSLA
jgi:hypothetical protein